MRGSSLSDGQQDAPAFVRLRARLEYLYLGRSQTATRFRFALLAFDLFTIGFFVIASMSPSMRWLIVADFAIGLILLCDLVARFAISRRKIRFVFDPVTLADAIVIVTLLAAAFLENWAFLRVLRALRLLRSYHVVRDLRRRFPFVMRNQDIIAGFVNLTVFIFAVTALVYVSQHDRNPHIDTYLDALYFTVTTLTTTGFGDITLSGEFGRLLAVVIMIIGVALFLRLVQAIFRPNKVKHRCPDCGLRRHDTDAVHCKHCGRTIKIETEGVA
jgi:voltage-gated potassium channel